MRMIIGQLLLLGTLFGVIYALKGIFSYGDVLIPPFDYFPVYLSAHWGELLEAAARTYVTAFVALMVTVILSVIGGVALSRSPRLADFALAWALAWQTFPIVALAPLLYVLLGDGLATTMFIAVTVAYFPLFLVVLSSVSTSQPRVESFFEQTAAWPRGGRLGVRFACSREAIANATLGSAALALVGAVIAEFLFGNRGIGYLIRQAQYQRDLTTILACLVVIALINIVYFLALRLIVRQMIHR